MPAVFFVASPPLGPRLAVCVSANHFYLTTPSSVCPVVLVETAWGCLHLAGLVATAWGCLPCSIRSLAWIFLLVALCGDVLYHSKQLRGDVCTVVASVALRGEMLGLNFAPRGICIICLASICVL